MAGEAEFEVLGLLPGSEVDEPLGLGTFRLPDLAPLLAVGGQPEGQTLCSIMKLGCLPVFLCDLPEGGGLLEPDDDVRLVITLIGGVPLHSSFCS